MRTLTTAREAFAGSLALVVPQAAERDRLLNVVKELVAWSARQGNKLSFYDEPTKQGAVSFSLAAGTNAFWSVYCVKRDKSAKLELMQRSARTLSGDLRQRAVDTLNGLSRDQIDADSVLKIDLMALKGEGARKQLFGLMDELLADRG